MLKTAKVLIMLVRLLGLVSVTLGLLVWSGTSIQMLGPHIGVGFAITLLLIVLAAMAIMRRAAAVGIAGLFFAFVLPYVGLKQAPFSFDWHLGAMQIAHMIVAIVALGVAESMYAAIRKRG